jgi:hypothetical protein
VSPRRSVDGTAEVESSTADPVGIDEIKDQWRRYGLAEGMRKQADTNHAREELGDSGLAPSDELQLLQRVQELERVVDVHTAIVRKLVSQIERAEHQPVLGADESSSSPLDRVAEGFVACPNCETRIAVALRADPPI